VRHPLANTKGGGQSGHGPIIVLGRGLPPPPLQAAEGIVKGQWIMEISRFFSLASLAILKYNIGNIQDILVFFSGRHNLTKI